MAFEETFEQDFDRARILRSAESASQETRDRLVASLPALTLSPGYHRYAGHLIQLEAEMQVGLRLDPRTTPSYESEGLQVLKMARSAFDYKHPPCSACGVRQVNRFAPQCVACGAKFRLRGR